jgi:histidine triad (HIT) family protein
VAEDPDCTFCRIQRGAVPAAVVLDEADILVFLDAHPLFAGHCLVVPRDHYATLEDLPVALIAPLFGAVQRVAVALPAALGADGCLVALNNVVSQSVAHVHVHVVPRRRKDGLRGFFWPRQRYADEAEMAATAERIRESLRAGR